MDESKALAEIEDTNIKLLLVECDEDFLQSFELTPADIKVLKKELTKNIMHPSSSIPMICRAGKCIAKESCPFIKINKPPVSTKCPIELMLMNQWKADYESSLEIDWNDKVERTLTCELIEIDILNMRANTVLSSEGFIMENAIGIDEQTGQAIYKKEKHIALDLKDMVANRRSKVLKEMLATREAKSKFLQEMRGDPSVYAAELRRKAEDLMKSHDIEVVDAEIEDFKEEDK